MGRFRATADPGFTLIEVVVSVTLLALISLAVGSFFAQGVATASNNERRLAAVALADQTMEQIRSIPPQTATGLSSKLVQGRSQSEVLARWNGTSPYPTPPALLAGSDPAWQASMPPVPPQMLVPFEQEFEVGTQTYTVENFIGTCRRSSVAISECLPSLATGAEIFRVIVRVSWDLGGGRTCSGRPCEYLLSTLVDPTIDPLFNSNSNPVSHLPPVADNDSATTPMDAATAIDVLEGDSGDLGPAPVTVTTPPNHGSASGAPSSPLTYAPAPGFYGTDTFTYNIVDRAGRRSADATVTITVVRPPPPIAVDDTHTVAAGSVTDFTVLHNDTLNGADSITFTQPDHGSVTNPSGALLTYTAPAAAVSTSFTYTLREPTGQESTATVRVTVAGTA